MWTMSLKELMVTLGHVVLLLFLLPWNSDARSSSALSSEETTVAPQRPMHHLVLPERGYHYHCSEMCFANLQECAMSESSVRNGTVNCTFKTEDGLPPDPLEWQKKYDKYIKEGCIDGWEGYENSCYYFSMNDARLDWIQAVFQCQTMNGILAQVELDEESTFIGEYVDGNTWIGLNDVAEEGIYLWSDGTQPSDYIGRGIQMVKQRGARHDLMWEDGQLKMDNQHVENCVYYNVNNGSRRWSVGRCSEEMGYVCEQPRGPHHNKYGKLEEPKENA